MDQPRKQTPPDAELFISAPLIALLEGIFRSNLTIGELAAHGDFGLGTFDGLDGEMIALDGEVFQAKSDGRIYRPDPGTHTPFACVTFFRGDSADRLAGTFADKALDEAIQRCLPSDNMLYALRLDGLFRRVKVRSVPKQECPRPLVEIAREQPMFEHHDIRGTLVGFYNPAFIVPVNAPGLHLHFIDDDRTVGGHLLSCEAVDPDIRIQHVPSMRLGLPMTFEYLTADLDGKDSKQSIHEAESDPGARRRDGGES